MISINFSFAENYKKDDLLDKNYNFKKYYICDNNLEISFWTWKIFFKNQIILIDTIYNFSKKIFLENKISCKNIQKTWYGSDLDIYSWEFSKNKKDVIFWITYKSKKLWDYKTDYFINQNLILSTNYNWTNIWKISRYGKHSGILLYNFGWETINLNDFFCQNDAWYYIDGKKVYCISPLYDIRNFLKNKGLTIFFSKEIYWQKKYNKFKLSEKLIKEIEKIAKTQKIQEEKLNIYKKIENFNKIYNSKKIENISKIDYKNYEILNYFYWYLKLLDAKSNTNFKETNNILKEIKKISNSEKLKQEFYRSFENLKKNNSEKYLEKKNIYEYLKTKDIYDTYY